MAPNQLARFVQNCFHQRIPQVEFAELLGLYNTRKHEIDSSQIVISLLYCVFDHCLENDRLIPLYTQTVLEDGWARPVDFILALSGSWRNRAKAKQLDAKYVTIMSKMLVNVAQVLPKLELLRDQAVKSSVLTARWLRAQFKIAAIDEDYVHNSSLAMIANVTTHLLISLLHHNDGQAMLDDIKNDKEEQVNKEIRETIISSMNIFPDISLRFIDLEQRYPGLSSSAQEPVDQAAGAELAVQQFETNVVHADVASTRIATCLYLYTKLLDTAYIDDVSLIAYISCRNGSEPASMFSDLLFASFDCLTKPMERSEPLYVQQCSIFLLNKLPALLAYIASMAAFAPIPTAEHVVAIWSTLNVGGDIKISSIVTRFLEVCRLYHLISDATFTSTTAMNVAASSVQGLLTKDSLLAQVNSDAARGPRLIPELIKNEGNVGPISYATIETMHNYCFSKDTNALKDLCNAVSKEPAAINAIGMFVKPSYCIRPLACLLDDWDWEEAHGESQQAYEEFGSVLLFIVLYKQRLNLSATELGIQNSSGFLARYLSSGTLSRPWQKLPENLQSYLNGWLKALYQSHGISDDLTSSCSPKDFYILLPTILETSMYAFSKDRLKQDSMRDGLDYMLEPFLLASLMTAAPWLACAATKDKGSATIMAQMLTKSPTNSDTNALHQVMLAASADNVKRAVAHVTDQTEYAEFLSCFSASDSFSVSRGLAVEQATASRDVNGGLVNSLSQALVDLTADPSLSLLTPRLVQSAIALHSSQTIIDVLHTFLVTNHSNAFFIQYLDIIATIIISTSTEGTNNISLIQATQYLHLNLSDLLKNGDSISAEVLVHLLRRVTFYTQSISQQATPLQDIMASSTMDPNLNLNLTSLDLDNLPIASMETGLDLTNGLSANDLSNINMDIDMNMLPMTETGQIQMTNADMDEILKQEPIAKMNDAQRLADVDMMMDGMGNDMTAVQPGAGSMGDDLFDFAGANNNNGMDNVDEYADLDNLGDIDLDFM